jgi:hypothetical protein
VLPRQWVKPIAFTLLFVGVIATVVALLYAGVRASSLPSWMPGYHQPIRLKSGHAVSFGPLKRYAAALLVLGVASLSVAWWVGFRYEPAD